MQRRTHSATRAVEMGLLALALLPGCASSVGPRDAGDLDATHCVPLTESPPRPLNICSDNGDYNGCLDWAQSHISAGIPRVDCIYDGRDYRCALADYCGADGGPGGVPGCACGHEPECGDGSLCVAATPDAEAHCQCATR